MVLVVKPAEVDYDALAMRVFLKSIDIVGGPKKLLEHRNLTWLPALMEASYVVVLKESGMKTEDENARLLGIARQTVRNILSADPETVLKKLEGERSERELKTHIAGGIARLAYAKLKQESNSGGNHGSEQN